MVFARDVGRLWNDNIGDKHSLIVIVGVRLMHRARSNTTLSLLSLQTSTCTMSIPLLPGFSTAPTKTIANYTQGSVYTFWTFLPLTSLWLPNFASYVMITNCLINSVSCRIVLILKRLGAGTLFLNNSNSGECVKVQDTNAEVPHYPLRMDALMKKTQTAAESQNKNPPNEWHYKDNVLNKLTIMHLPIHWILSSPFDMRISFLISKICLAKPPSLGRYILMRFSGVHVLIFMNPELAVIGRYSFYCIHFGHIRVVLMQIIWGEQKNKAQGEIQLINRAVNAEIFNVI